MNKDEKPKISRILYRFEPIILPNINLGFILLIAVTPAAISGSDVPKAIKLKPITDSEIPKTFDISIALITVISAPKTVKKIEIIIIGIPKRIG